jgi:geranyl-CoA carboxylase alpha subunit
MTPFTRLLVANRGEIARRVIRSARAAGLHTIAVYSQADAGAPHTLDADESVLLGPAPAAQSYLSIERVVEAANSTGADAVHPGYGFLSENSAFAAACRDADLVFVGPSPQAIALMGNKSEAKRTMVAANVPCIPGFEVGDNFEVGDDGGVLLKQASDVGFPLMVKAAAGGGGRGMRQVHSIQELEKALDGARSEALNAFGSDELLIEKLITGGRHVEVQILADRAGHTIHLGERDCSVQRRHQKVLEEAPSPAVDSALRARMGEAACAAARAVNYEGAGTVEFLLADDASFYFLEMNTRLQVEHPVTEMVCGVDIVDWQLRIASGESLTIEQADVTLTGSAIEARLYAENPGKRFLPSPGRVVCWKPADGAGVRVDSGVESDVDVSAHYDPMLAKVIAHGPDRATARRRLRAALLNTVCFGPQTNRAFLITMLDHPVFAAGQATTDFLDGLAHVHPSGHAIPDAPALAIIGALRQTLGLRNSSVPRELWNWNSAGLGTISHYSMRALRQDYAVVVRGLEAQCYVVDVGDISTDVTVERIDEHEATVWVDSRRETVQFFEESPEKWHLARAHANYVLTDVSPIAIGGALGGALGAGTDAAAGADDGGIVRAPMHGRLVKIAVRDGDAIKTHQLLAVVEAMKMRHEVRATSTGVVKDIRRAEDTQVAEGDELMTIGPKI